MLDFFQRLFSSDAFMPHGMCFSWDPAVLWSHVVSDVLIAAAYYTIPILLFSLRNRRRDIPFNSIFVAFGIFILACGTTHLMAAITVWYPLYRLDAVIKIVTAVASIVTCFMLVPLMPTLISLPSPAQLAKANDSLADEVVERRAAEAEVRKINEELEARVALRTADLKKAAEDLRGEMKRRRELESQLIHSQKMEAVGRLAGGVAHDFNNLLTVILGYNEMLREHAKADAVTLEYAQEIQHASERATSLTSQLLAFSRRQVAVPRIVDLNDVVRQVDRMLRRIIGEDIELSLRLDPALSRVKVDPSHMDQVIMNLAVNSRDAMPNGGRLTIETANILLTEDYAATRLGVQPGPHVMLAISDTGVGMDAETKSHIYEPFFTTKEKGKGTGLGLSIVYGIIKQNGGEILVYSEPGQGTVFKIYLPVAGEPVEAVPSAIEAVPPRPAQGTIVLVEDEDQVRNLAKAMLTKQGYKVIAFPLAKPALDFLLHQSEPVDLLLTDIVMPRMSGVDLVRELMVERPDLPVIFMSGYTDTGVADRGLLKQGMPFIQKPFSSDALCKLVREVMLK